MSPERNPQGLAGTGMVEAGGTGGSHFRSWGKDVAIVLSECGWAVMGKRGRRIWGKITWIWCLGDNVGKGGLLAWWGESLIGGTARPQRPPCVRWRRAGVWGALLHPLFSSMAVTASADPWFCSAPLPALLFPLAAPASCPNFRCGWRMWLITGRALVNLSRCWREQWYLLDTWISGNVKTPSHKATERNEEVFTVRLLPWKLWRSCAELRPPDLGSVLGHWSVLLLPCLSWEMETLDL